MLSAAETYSSTSLQGLGQCHALSCRDCTAAGLHTARAWEELAVLRDGL